MVVEVYEIYEIKNADCHQTSVGVSPSPRQAETPDLPALTRLPLVVPDQPDTPPAFRTDRFHGSMYPYAFTHFETIGPFSVPSSQCLPQNGHFQGIQFMWMCRCMYTCTCIIILLYRLLCSQRATSRTTVPSHVTCTQCLRHVSRQASLCWPTTSSTSSRRPSASAPGPGRSSQRCSARGSRSASKFSDTSPSPTDDNWRPCWVSLMHRYFQLLHVEKCMNFAASSLTCGLQ